MSPASHVVSRLRKLYGLVLSNTRVLCQERMHPRCRTLGLAGGVAVEPLEPRLLLSVAASGQAAPYLPPQHFLAESNGYLTEPSSGRPLDIAMQYLTSHAGLLGCGAGDIQQSIVTDQYVSADTGVTHIYLRQQYDGMDIVNANLCVNVTADGRLLNVGGGFVNGVNAAPAVLLASAGPRLSPDQAIAKAAEALNLTSSGAAMALDAASPATLSEASLSLDPIPTKLEYIATPQGIFEIKYFFTHGYTNSEGESVSNESVRQAILALVRDESSRHPHSDQDMVRLLNEQGLEVARRTVAKYREQLGILPSHLRKSF